MIISCLNCSKSYEIRLSKVLRAKKHFCCLECRKEYYKKKKEEKEKTVRHRSDFINKIIIKDKEAILIVNSKKYGKKEVLIDSCNIEKIKNIFWHIRKVYDNYFSVVGYDKQIKKEVFLHRYIMNFPNGLIDHINKNPLDNRLSNLRVVSHSENMLNGTTPKNNVLQHKGIRKRYNKYQARIMVNKKSISLGHFETLEEAIKEREKYCKENNIIF